MVIGSILRNSIRHLKASNNTLIGISSKTAMMHSIALADSKVAIKVE
jgi:hypothetical protein